MKRLAKKQPAGFPGFEIPVLQSPVEVTETGRAREKNMGKTEKRKKAKENKGGSSLAKSAGMHYSNNHCNYFWSLASTYATPENELVNVIISRV